MIARLWALLPAIVLVVVLAGGAIDAEAKQRVGATSPVSSAASSDAGSIAIGSIVSTLAPVLATPGSIDAMSIALEALITASGAAAALTLVELGGAAPVVRSVNGSEVFTAASTYKLAALMLEAQDIAAGIKDPNGVVCFQADDYEAGWFDDYSDGACFTRNDLALRAGTYSDNTAGHMLVRDVGGASALNAWAASAGATSSAFFDGNNTTTSSDLAALWVAEAEGKLGGAAAQAWLYPVLTNTRTESGVPAGVSGATVVHKTGTIDLVENDAALVTPGPAGPYVLVVLTDGLGGTDGWQLIANLSAAVWQFEAARAAAVSRS
jgi:beta-lactamase class A